MEKFIIVFMCVAAVAVILPYQQVIGSVIDTLLPPGCDGNDACADLCTNAFAGSGSCVNEKYCQCDNCPIRHGNTTTSLNDTCTMDPTCGAFCPPSTFSMSSSGKAFFGHRCFLGSSQYCVCFCLPTSYKPYQEAFTPTTAAPNSD